MAQASTLVPVTKTKKAQAWTLALSWGIKKHASGDARYRWGLIAFSLFTYIISISDKLFWNPIFLAIERILYSSTSSSNFLPHFLARR